MLQSLVFTGRPAPAELPKTLNAQVSISESGHGLIVLSLNHTICTGIALPAIRYCGTVTPAVASAVMPLFSVFDASVGPSAYRCW